MNPLAGIRGIVLDIDDTLYLERDYVRSGFDAVGTWAWEQHGVANVADIAWNLFVRGTRGTTLGDALTSQGRPELLEEAIQIYRNHQPSIELLPDSRTFLDSMRDRRLAVVTDGPAASQRAKFSALGLNDRIDCAVFTAEVGSSKPDPAVFVRAAESWTFPPEELVYVADNPLKDFQGPASLGWRSVRVRRAGSLHESIPSPGYVVEVTSLAALIERAIGRD